tara:strand:+ start:730 stop:1107 length:378 start_codon:yes stop_codon:yes gene_type:complete
MIEVHNNDQNDTISFSSGESEYNIYSALDKVIADVAEPCTNCNDDYYRKTKVDGQFKDCCTACQCDECNGSGFTQSELTVQEIFERVMNILQRQNDQINYAKSETQRLQANIEMKDKEIKELLSD